MAAPHVARRDNCLARQAVQESASKAIEGDWATAWHGASVAFRKRPQSYAHRLFTGPTAKVRSGSIPAVRLADWQGTKRRIRALAPLEAASPAL